VTEPATLDFSLRHVSRQARFAALYREPDLYRAVLKTYTKSLFFWRKAISRSHDDRTLYDFARRTPQNVDRLHEMLRRGSFHFREGIEVTFRLSSKERSVFIFPWEERIVDLLLYLMLNRHFDAEFSPQSYAYRYRGFGVDACQHRIARRLAALPRPVYFAKRDIASYFPSVDHEILLSGLAQWVDPRDYLFELLEERVRFRYRAMERTETASCGIPFGSAMACFYANFYLTPLDRAMGDLQGVDYYRYADDLLLFSPGRDEALAAMECLDRQFQMLKLESKPSHHQDVAFLGTGDSDDRFRRVMRFRHLGLEYREDGSIGLSRDKSRKIRNLFRFAFRRAGRRLPPDASAESRAQLAVEVARRVIESRTRSVAIIDYYLKHVDDEEQLRQLDRWLAEEVLSFAFRNGHRRGNFRTMPFARLRAMGLPSLRHRRRLLRHGHIESSFFRWRTPERPETTKRPESGH
jgi:hypothetical protein